MSSRVGFAVAACLFFWAGNTLAQSTDSEKEHAVVELGGAAFRDITNSASSFGVDAAIEVTPIKNWLELEFGTTGLFRRHSTEWAPTSCSRNLIVVRQDRRDVWWTVPKR